MFYNVYPIGNTESNITGTLKRYAMTSRCSLKVKEREMCTVLQSHYYVVLTQVASG